MSTRGLDFVKGARFCQGGARFFKGGEILSRGARFFKGGEILSRGGGCPPLPPLNEALGRVMHAIHGQVQVGTYLWGIDRCQRASLT